MAGYLGSRPVVVQVDGYQRTEAEARYVNVSGDDFTGHLDFTDDAKARFGSSDEMHIYTESSGSGYSYIQGDNIVIRKADQSTNYLTALAGVLSLQPGGGNVGIGETSPARGLSIHKEGNHLQLTTNTSGTTAGNGTDLKVDASSSEFQLLNYESAGIAFFTSGAQKVTIDSSGNVGIGVTAPSDSTNNGDNLVIGGESNVGMSFLSNATSGNGAIYFADGTSGTAAYRGILSYSHSDDAMDFGTASTAARVRIDSSGKVGIGTSSPFTLLELSSTDPILRFNDSNGGTDTKNFELRYVGTNSPDIDGLYFRTANDANDTYSDKLTILGSGKVGIGTNAPDDVLEVKGSTNNTTRQVKIVDSSDATATHIGQLNNVSYFSNNAHFQGGAWVKDDSAVGTSFLGLGDGVVQFGTDTGATPTERMRIDSSGNALFNTTDANPGNNSGGSDVGVVLDTNGKVLATTNNAEVMVLNRQNGDGDIAEFRQDGSPVGAIFNGGGNLGIDSDGGLLLVNDIITPTSSNDATHDIGRSSARYKDLYLSGGVNFSANSNLSGMTSELLDDYEEGTYTATLSPGTSGSITVDSSYNTLSYTKIGRQVTVTGRIRLSAASSPVGFSANLSLPFVNNASSSQEAGRIIGVISVAYAAQPINAYGIHPTTTGVSYVNVTQIDASNFPTNSAQDFSGDEHIGVMITYSTG